MVGAANSSTKNRRYPEVSGTAKRLPDASDIGLSVSLFRRATPQWLIYDAKLAGENVVAWRYLPAHLRQSENGAALWTKLPDWVVAGDLTADQTGMVPRLAAYSHASSSGWLVYPLAARALDKPLTDRKKLADLANHLLGALDALHKRETLHLDVHPSNIREVDGRFVLAGMGIDVRVQAGAATGSNEGLGRKHYAPPELWDASGRSRLGPWTDIFSAAATLYFAICGQDPADFRDRLTRPRWREAIAYDLNRELAKSGAAWPKMVAFIIAGLAIKVEERPKSVLSWSKVWTESVPDTASTLLSRPDDVAGKTIEGNAAVFAKPAMLRNGLLGLGGLALGIVAILLYVAFVVPMVGGLFGLSLGVGQSAPLYVTLISMLAFQIAALLAVDGFAPRLHIFMRTGLLIPAFLGMLVRSWNDWGNWGSLLDALNLAGCALLFASLAAPISKMQQIFYKYSSVVLVIAIALLFLDIYSYDDVLLWLES
jgi:hypothetical protein